MNRRRDPRKRLFVRTIRSRKLTFFRVREGSFRHVSANQLTLDLLVRYVELGPQFLTISHLEAIQELRDWLSVSMPAFITLLLPSYLESIPMTREVPGVIVLRHPRLALQIPYRYLDQWLPENFNNLPVVERRQQLPILMRRIASRIIRNFFSY